MMFPKIFGWLAGVIVFIMLGRLPLHYPFRGDSIGRASLVQEAKTVVKHMM